MTKRIDVRELAATGTRDATTYLRGDGTWTAPSGAVLTTEDVQDIVGAMVVAGSNVTATYDDSAGTLTIASTGGGGSLVVQDENGNVATGVTQIDFQGAGVTASAGTGEVVVTIPGGGGGGSLSLGEQILLGSADIVAVDDFNRADASTLGSASTGQAWTAHAGTWSIVSGRAKTTAGTGERFASIDAGVGNGRYRATIRRGAGATPGLAFRVTDNSNALFVYYSAGASRVDFFKRVGGANTLLAAGTSNTLWPEGEPLVFEVVVRGSVLKAFLDGQFVAQHTLSAGDLTTFPATKTRWGFYVSDTNTTFDDLVVKA